MCASGDARNVQAQASAASLKFLECRFSVVTPNVEPTAHPESESSAPGDEGMSWARRYTGAGCASVPPVQCPLDRASCGPLLSLGPEARAPAGVPTGGRKGGVSDAAAQRSQRAPHSGVAVPLCEECWRVGDGMVLVVGRSRERRNTMVDRKFGIGLVHKDAGDRLTREGKDQRVVHTYKFSATLSLKISRSKVPCSAPLSL